MKKILVAADILTNPCDGGSNQCISQYVNLLSKLGYDVFYLVIRTSFTPNDLSGMCKRWGDHLLVYDTPKVQVLYQKVIKRLLHTSYPNILDFYTPWGIVKYINKLQNKYNFDGLIVNYIWQSKLSYCKIPTKAIFTHDVFSYRDERMKAGNNWFHFPVATEAHAIRRFNHILSIQDEENNFYRYLNPNCNVVSVYTHIKFIDQPITHGKNILFFSGGGDLNLSGIKNFITNVWPKLMKFDPQINLLIGGSICRSLKGDDLHSNIKLLGRFDDVSKFYEMGDIVINPVYEGTGLKIKTMEALGYGKTTIVDPHSAIGIFKPDKSPLLIANNQDEFVNLIITSLYNEEQLKSNKEKAEKYIDSLNKHVSAQYKQIFN